MSSAPGRVNLIGEHTDYNGGEVLPIAIAHRTWVAASLSNGEDRPSLHAVSADEPRAGRASLIDPTRSGYWFDYVTGVAAPMLRSLAQSVRIAVASDVPRGAGLSSSAALEVATATAVSALLQKQLPPNELARIAWRAETGFVGVECGIMDQFASAMCREGEALHLDCATELTDYAPFRENVLIIDSGVRRSLRDSAFNLRRAECAEALRLLRERWPALISLTDAEPEQVRDAKLPAPFGARALHVSMETRRVREAVTLLREHQSLTRELLVGSHESLRDLYECSSPELDWLVARAVECDGVIGARLTGAGWGGCVIAIGSQTALENAAAILKSTYVERFRIMPRTWLTTASSGARLEWTV